MIVSLIDQSEVWIDREKVTHQIADMSNEYRRNVIGFLERNVERIEFTYAMHDLIFTEKFGLGGVAGDALVAATDERMADPLTWLRSTPLYRAMLRGLPSLPNGPRCDGHSYYDDEAATCYDCQQDREAGVR